MIARFHAEQTRSSEREHQICHEHWQKQDGGRDIRKPYGILKACFVDVFVGEMTATSKNI